jgi:hypothetical protein
LRKHRREPASDPATAKSARNRKSKITCDEHSSSDRACRQSGRIEDSGGKRKAMEQIDDEQAYPLDGGLDDGGLGGGGGRMELPLGPPTVP